MTRIHVHLGRKTARDSEEGRWVTINGTHVMIGKSGKITKGPAALTGKTQAQAHQHAAKEHEAHAAAHKAAGRHEQAAKHEKAAGHHTEAANAFHIGNDGLGSEHAKKAEKAHAEAQTVHTSAPKPKAHEKLHNEAGMKVTQLGSKKHKDEHDRLMKMYGESKANWEREAVNRLISKNAVHAGQEYTAKKDADARGLSAAAHKSGKAEDHQKAIAALKHAEHMHGQHGGPGYAKHQDELAALRKTHEKAHADSQKPKASEALSGKKDGKPAAAPAPAAQPTGKPGTPGNLHKGTSAKDLGEVDAAHKAGDKEKLKVLANHEHPTVKQAAQKKLNDLDAKEQKAKGKPAFGGQHMPQGGATPGHAALQHSQIAKAHHTQANIDGGTGDKKSADKHRKMAAAHEAAAKAHLAGSKDAQALSDEANKQTATHHPDFGKTLYDAKDKKVHAAAKKMDAGQAAHAASAHYHGTQADVAKRAGDENLAKMHKDKAKHHEYIAGNPGEDHSARGAKIKELGDQIDAHEKAKAKLTGKPGAKAPGKGSSGPAKASGHGGAVQGATEALKAAKDAVKKAGDAADPDPKKQS